MGALYAAQLVAAIGGGEPFAASNARRLAAIGLIVLAVAQVFRRGRQLSEDAEGLV